MVWLITKKGNMEDLRYTSIKWEDHFYIDETSPSGLRRSKDIYAGINPFVLYKKGTMAGSKSCPNNKPECWRTSLKKKSYKVHRIMWILIHGTIDKGSVIDHLDGNPLNNSINNLSLKTHRANQQNQKRHASNTSGANGVRRRYNLWYCTWRGLNKERCYKYFSVNKYGEIEAFNMAVNWRLNELQKLNEQGMNYTDRHMST